jgi:hypothetical protein
VSLFAVLHDKQINGHTTTWYWTAPPDVNQLAEILVVAGEGGVSLCLHSTFTCEARQEAPHPISLLPLQFCTCLTCQVVVVAAPPVVAEVVLVDSSTGPTTQSHLAQPTPLSLAKGGQGATDLVVMVSMGMTPYFLHLIHRQH